MHAKIIVNLLHMADGNNVLYRALTSNEEGPRVNLFRACCRDLRDFLVTVCADPAIRAIVTGIYGLHTQLWSKVSSRHPMHCLNTLNTELNPICQ